MRSRGSALAVLAAVSVACNALLGIDERSEALPERMPEAAVPGEAGASDGGADATGDACDGCSTVLAVAQGPAEGHACALVGDKTARCWGEAGKGRLGIGAASGKMGPVAPKLTGIDKIAVGGQHTCAIARGKLYCWGANDEGQVTGNPGSPVLEPTLIGVALEPVAAIAPGVAHTCAASASGDVQCWGRNAEKQLGQDHARPRAGFATVAAGPAAHLCSGLYHACAASADKVLCWGDRSRVELADNVADAGGGPLPPRFGFIAVGDSPYVENTQALVCGARHTCALVAKDSAVVCWGANDEGQLGSGSTSATTHAVRSSKLYSSSTVSVGDGNTCVVHGGALRCVGRNDRGQLGSVGASSTSLVTAFEGAALLGGARNHACATQAGRLMCWGANDNGQLGPGSTAPSSATPVAVPLP